MKLCSIETTPNPNCMKLNLDEQISAKPVTLNSGTEVANLPEVARQLFAIDGIRSIFLANDFITLMRESSADWQPILVEAAHLIGLAEGADSGLADITQTEEQKTTAPDSTPVSIPNRDLYTTAAPASDIVTHLLLSDVFGSNENRYNQNLGEVEVAIQVFRDIPVQIRATGDGEQARVALPERFNQALQRALAATGANYVVERRWQQSEPRFGKPDEVAQMVADERACMIDEQELARIETAAIAVGGGVAIANHSDEKQVKNRPSQQSLLAELGHIDWERRLKAIQKIEVNDETFPAVLAALDDDQSAIRRWAAAILGGSGMPEAVEPLCRVVLSDTSVVVRRTAGDALSDLGDAQAIATMCQALEDRSKLVRWRAARFLNEVGDETAVEPLRRAAERESEFDVRVEMLAAMERIEDGGETQMPMWMRIAKGVG